MTTVPVGLGRRGFLCALAPARLLLALQVPELCLHFRLRNLPSFVYSLTKMR